MLTKVFVSIFLGAAVMTACGGNDNTTTPDGGCVGHTCGNSDVKVTDPEAGNIIFEYIYFDTELQAAFKLPAGVTTANRVMAYFMSAQTPQSNPLPAAGQCNNLVATKGWPETVGTSHTDIDVGALTITGKNTANADVTITVPKLPAGTDQIGRTHDIFYQTVQPGAELFLKPDSAYTVNLGGAGTFPATTYKDALFLAANFTVDMPTLEGDGPLTAGTDFPVKWNPQVSANLPPKTGLIGGDVLGVTWLVDTTGAPTHICPVAHSSGQFTIPGTAIAEYKQIAQSRGLPTTKMILLRNAIVHQVVRLPSADATNQRRIDMLTVMCWAQLMNVN
jgi:hypothetical protein